MDALQHATPGKLKFLHTELATARAFLDIAETSCEERAVYRNVQNAESSITAIHEALATRDIDPAHADEIRTAAGILSGRLHQLVAR